VDNIEHSSRRKAAVLDFSHSHTSLRFETRVSEFKLGENYLRADRAQQCYTPAHTHTCSRSLGQKIAIIQPPMVRFCYRVWSRHIRYTTNVSRLKGQSRAEKTSFLIKSFRFLGLGFGVFLGFTVRTPDTKLMTQKLTKNSSYMIHYSSCHIIYSHVQTVYSYEHKLNWKARIFCCNSESNCKNLKLRLLSFLRFFL